MDDPPEILKNVDLERTADTVESHLKAAYVDHPTRGPYVTSRKLYEDLEDDLDDRFSLELFGMFCERCPYLEQWSRGYGGSYRYRILEDELESSTHG